MLEADICCSVHGTGCFMRDKDQGAVVGDVGG